MDSNLPDEIQEVTLLQLLNNTLILHHTIPYLPISSTLALGATSKSFRELIHQTPYVFRHLDLTNNKVANSLSTGRIGKGHTETDFYSGPLNGVLNNLRRRDILKHVQTLVLDGLSVPARIPVDIILNNVYNVRLLSIRQVHDFHERTLIQALQYAIRSSRPEGTPKLKGLYIFGPKDPPPSTSQPPQAVLLDDGMRSTVAASIGSSWNKKSSDNLSKSLYGTSEKWYRKSGKMIQKTPIGEWGSVLLECKDLISFDAPLCAGPRHTLPTQVKDPKMDSGPWYQKEEFYIPPRVATYALEGCHSCGKAPEGLAEYGGQFPEERFPLLSPVPIHHSTIKAAKRPDAPSSASFTQPRIIARCQECLRNRYCENCHKWWCEDCYDVSTRGHNLHPLSMIPTQQESDGFESLSEQSSASVSRDDLESNKVKGVSRECWDCGLTCYECSVLTQQRCKICGGGYCTIHNEGSTLTTCDWCSTGRNRHRELY